MADQQADVIGNAVNSVVGSRFVQQAVTIVGLAAAIAIGVAIVMWTREPSFRTLYSGIEPERAAAVVEALDSAGIPHRFESNSGSVLVPVDKLHDARLQLAGAGLNRSAGGMAILDEESGFGISEFMQSRKYHHALESELARTIESMHQVRRARIHLAIPKQSVFVRDRKPPSASVLLDVVPGATIRTEQVSSVVNLVAASISDLQPENVTVVDQQGSLLSQSKTPGSFSSNNRHFEYQRQVESVYEDRITGLLAPITGAHRLRVQVAADMDFTVFQESRESWSPENRVVRSEQINSEGGGEQAAGGIPGALANRPVGEEAEDGKKTTKGSQSITRNYEIERILNHVEKPGGEIRRLSVAILVDNLRVLDEEGNAQTVPVTPEELEKYERLVSDAIGFSDNRGDSITVVSADFRNAEDPLEITGSQEAFWQTAWFGELLRQSLSGLAVILLVLMVIRPGLKSLIDKPLLPAATAAGQQQVAAIAGSGAQPAAGSAAALAPPQQAAPSMLPADMNSLRDAAGEDPARVAQVVKKWVGDTDG